MSVIPSLSGVDHTLSFLREGYDFMPRRFERLGTDIFEARLGLRKTVCVRGREAAEVFYDRDRFRRRDAAPGRVSRTLFGRGGVQGLDGAAHRHRKAMLMAVMSEASIERMVELFETHWRRAIGAWVAASRVELLLASREILCRTVCDWAAVPLGEDEVGHRAEQLARLFEAPAAVGPRYWKGRVARKRANAWIADIVEQVRSGELEVPEGSPAHLVSFFQEDGELLEPRVAAVELVNLLRPTVAIERYITFTAMALHQHARILAALDPEWDPEDSGDAESFVQEVRRVYPFFPAVGARVRMPFEWRGHRFEEGRLVLLDLYGTNHDRRLWEEPESFRPRRFRDREISPFSLIPQGGGDHHGNHRCAGEWLTIAVMRSALRLLTREMTYRVPDQDLTIDHSRMPARPASGFVIEGVRRAKG
jgi:fatty-acid peroxygenase